MTEDDGLTVTPVFVVNLRAVVGGEEIHTAHENTRGVANLLDEGRDTTFVGDRRRLD
jgi:hypothetical protein